MIKYSPKGTYLINGAPSPAGGADPAKAREGTMAYKILRAHDRGGAKDRLSIRFDALMSHDITYVGIIQTARASGMEKFPMPYVLTNCHNSLAAVGGTINEDDHVFGLTAARKYGGIYVPANQAVCHQFMRERLSRCGGMILGSDSHTRYGCYGTMGVGEGGGELAKQLLMNTWDIDAPEVVLVWVHGEVPHGVGPHDVAISLCGEVFPKGLVKNKILEFAGPGVAALPMDFRIGIDVMTTETSCLSSIWITDDETKKYFDAVGRPEAFAELRPDEGAWYDAVVDMDLSTQECMIALPFHPSNAVSIRELNADPYGILSKCQEDCNRSLEGVKLDLTSKIVDGRVTAQQGIIVGCSGGLYDDIVEAAAILDGGMVGNGEFNLSVYPASTPTALALTRGGTIEKLLRAGAVIKPSFCGPCFGAGDTPADGALSIRHATRNFMSREGSKPGEGQIASVALMDARSIAATARNGGVITAASDIDYEFERSEFVFDPAIYDGRIYDGYGLPKPEEALRLGPNITDWPKMFPLGDNLLLRICAAIYDDVTTTDELIPSGETSSLRSNPVRLSDFALSRRAPDYVPQAKKVRQADLRRREGDVPAEITEALAAVSVEPEKLAAKCDYASCVFAKKPGDGSAREQAASCQKVLGGGANICFEYATKRYRSNLINWGVVPFTASELPELRDGDAVYVPDIRDVVASAPCQVKAFLIRGGKAEPLALKLDAMTENEKEILLDGCLINWYGRGRK
ncbi:MAG: hydratase [Oscillospiraceae bacterium]|nr:hydratase [Oscillospiraceae bacterium]